MPKHAPTKLDTAPFLGAAQIARSVWERGEHSQSTDWVASETAVALMYNCISHVVMMATPDNLADFAIGFSLSEGIVESVDDILDIEIVEEDRGVVISILIPEGPFEALKTQRRNMTGRTGCGMCGAETLDQAMRAPKVVEGPLQVSHAAIQKAVTGFSIGQKLNDQTGGVHAAVWCDLDGNSKLLREDVGRHNALDKLIGALAVQNKSLATNTPQSSVDDQGFVLVTSRASYEMVAKVASANIKVLVAVSAPTTLAIDIAKQSGVSLLGFSKQGRHSVYFGEHRIIS